MYKILGIILFLAVLSLSLSPAYAAVRCETQYGGREVCVRTGQLQIDKEIFNPQENKFVDNLGINDHKFAPGDEITFRLKVKNVGDATFDNVSVTDSLPSLLGLTSGSTSFTISNLTPGQTEERELKAKVTASGNFPVDKTLVCVVNTAEASSGNEKDRDTAQVCLERKAVGPAPAAGPQKLPPTGPEDWLPLLVLGTLTGISGLYLTKFSKREIKASK